MMVQVGPYLYLPMVLGLPWALYNDGNGSDAGHVRI